MTDNYIDVKTMFKPIIKSKGEFLNSPAKVQEIVYNKLNESDLITTYINNTFDLQVGDLIEIPFGKYGTNLGIVYSIPSKQKDTLPEGIEYKEVLSDRIY